MTWLLLATGFLGGLTLAIHGRRVYRWLVPRQSVEVFYSPKGGCTETIVREIRRARREILVLAFSFTSKPIAQALVEARGRGVSVEILLDQANEQEAMAQIGALIGQGLTLLLDGRHASAHNKVILIDRHIVMTGSFDFTQQAETENAENLLLIRGHTAVVNSYREHFSAHRAHSQPAWRPGSGARKAA